MTTLGQLLAANVADEISKTVPPAVLAEQKRQARIREIHETGERFFEKAKNYFTNGITTGVLPSKLEMQIGGRGFKEADDHNEEVESIVSWYHDKNGHRFNGMSCGTNGLPAAMTDPDRFAASWEDFTNWAAANELEAYWQLGRGGVAGWLFLRVKPASHVALATA